MTLEKLLNILCEKGWKPFGWKDIKRINNEGWFVCFVHKSKKRPWLSEVSHRELVSKESNLWQFVCENGMAKDVNPNEGKYPRDKMDEEEHIARNYCVNYYHSRKKDRHKTYNKNYYEYRLIESALCDEDKLENFILENIKIDEN